MTTQSERILLSAPDVSISDRDAILRAFDGGWIAPVGPELTLFEQELADYVGVEACAALSSGTAALHLALLDADIGPGDEVVVQTATFAASAFAVVHAGATPVLCDIDRESWGLCPERLSELLATKATAGRLPKAVMPVDLYGSCGDYSKLEAVCAEYSIPVIEDAAEALGSRSKDRMAGSFGRSAAVSFNGNKIMTTSGGGALLGELETVERARFLATQARAPELHYEHHEIGYNYRLSNILAALGRSQLEDLENKIARRTVINDRYTNDPRLDMLEWCRYQNTERPNHWLNVALLPVGVDPTTLCRKLDGHGIEARPAWKPMHLQPVFADAEVWGGQVSEELFNRGLCLPSGSGLSDDDVDRVLDTLVKLIAEFKS